MCQEVAPIEMYVKNKNNDKTQLICSQQTAICAFVNTDNSFIYHLSLDNQRFMWEAEN